MAINQSIYGDKRQWVPLYSGSSLKLPNFGDNMTTLREGYVAQRLKTDAKLNNSIVHSALGEESALSNLYYYYQGEAVYEDHFTETQYVFATGDSCVASNRYSFEPSSQASSTKLGMITPKTSTEGLGTRPIIDYDYKRLRAVIGVAVASTKNPNWSEIHGMSLHDYLTGETDTEPPVKYTTLYPYIKYAYINLYEKIGDSPYHNISYIGQKGIIIFNKVSLYKFFKNTATSTFSKGQSGLLIGTSVPSGYTPYSSTIRILGITSEYGGASDTIGGINKRYVNSFTDGVTVETEGNLTYCYREYDSGFEEYIKRQTACFGIQFVLSPDDLDIDLEDESTTKEDADKVYIGILDSNFVGHGDYVQGTAILTQPQYGLESADDSPYTPSSEEGEDDFGELNSLTHAFSGGGGGYTIYNLTEANMSLLMQWLNSTEAGETGQNYAQYLSSIKFSVFGMHTRGSEQTLRVAGELVNVGSTAVKGYTGYRVDVFTSSSFTFERYFNDFRDFEPYTQITLKLPFADTIKLNAGEWYNHTLSVRYAVDELTGTGSCMIYRDSLQYASVNCSMFIEVPVSALNSGTYNNALIQAKTSRNSALLGIGSTAVSLGASVSTANALGISASGVGLVGAIDRYKQAEYNLGHIPKSISHIGSAGDITDCFFEWRPNIIIERPQMLPYDKEAYADTVGYACLKTGTLSSFSGLTVCSEVKLSDFGATAEEKRLIKEALCKGVYL